MSTESSRRAFLAQSLAVLSAATTAPVFLMRTSFALDANSKHLEKDLPTLVVVQLSGGNDGLSTVIPIDNDDHRRARPKISGATASKIITLDRNQPVGLHPNLTGFKDLYDAGNLAVIQGVGYPNPNRSHFRSMEIWHTAEPVKAPTTGWLGRYFDAQCKGNDPKDLPDPKSAVNIGATAPLALQGNKFTAISFQRPEAYQWFAGNRNVDGKLRKTFNEVNQLDTTMADAAAATSGNPTLDFLERTALEAQLTSDEIRAVTTKYRPGVAYPGNPFGNALQMVSQMIAGGLSTRVYYVSLGGFDTHTNQINAHDRLMTELSAGLSAFMKDLKSQGNDQKTLVMTFSEFGRRVSENASGGTDHGTAAPMFLMGAPIKAGIYGPHPSLRAEDLDHGDLKFNIDFRNIYATVLDGWLKTDLRPILGAAYKSLPILRA